jgi:hypothetical protein
MPRAYAGDAPQVARRTSDVRERQEWNRRNINPKNPESKLTPQQQAVADYWDAVHKADEEKQRRWAAEREEREAAIAARYESIKQANARIVAQREHQRLLTMMFEQHGATESERNRVTLLVESRYPPDKRVVELYEMTLLKLRAELDKVPAGQMDWRPAIGGKR